MSVPTIGKSGAALVAQPAPTGQANDGASRAALTPSPQQSPPANQADVQKALQAIKEKLGSLTSSDSLQFSIDGSSGEVVARVTDSKTGELIRQIPSKEALAIAQDLDQLKGLLLRQQA